MPLTLDWKEWRARSLAKSQSNSKQSQDDKENVAPRPTVDDLLFSSPCIVSPISLKRPEKSYKWAPNESERQAMKEVYESQMTNYLKKKKEQTILKEFKEHCEQQHIEWRQRQIEYMKKNPHITIDLDYPWDENAIA